MTSHATNTGTNVVSIVRTIAKHHESQFQEMIQYCVSEGILQSSHIPVLQQFQQKMATKMFELIDKKPRKKRSITSCQQCIAFKANKERCTRSRKRNTLFCASHVRALPHGRIFNDTLEAEIREYDAKKYATTDGKEQTTVTNSDTSVNKTTTDANNNVCDKGGKRTRRTNHELTTPDGERVVSMHIEEIAGTVYLVDSNNLVYTYEVESPLLLGKKIDEQTIEFLQEHISYD